MKWRQQVVLGLLALSLATVLLAVWLCASPAASSVPVPAATPAPAPAQSMQLHPQAQSQTQTAAANKGSLGPASREWVKGPVMGIDFGSTSSCMGVLKDPRESVQIIPNYLGNRQTPSVVSFTASGEPLAGEAAQLHARAHPNNTNTVAVTDIKRLLGRSMHFPPLQRELQQLPYRVVESRSADRPGWLDVDVLPAADGHPALHLSPEQIAAMIIANLKDSVEPYFGKPVSDDAVLTYPASWSSDQREALQAAATLAGLRVQGMLPEPVAAAMAFGLESREPSEGQSNSRVLVLHLGGASCHASVLRAERGALQLLSHENQPSLGGRDFDRRLLSHVTRVMEERRRETLRGGIDIDISSVSDPGDYGPPPPWLLQRMQEAKRRLSSEQRVRVETNESLDDESDGDEVFITRAEFESMNEDLFQRVLTVIARALQQAHLNCWDIDHLLLEGSSMRIPRVQQIVKEFFRGKRSINSQDPRGIHPGEIVAYGASLAGAALTGFSLESLGGDRRGDIHVMWDTATLAVGVEIAGGLMHTVISRGDPAVVATFSRTLSTYEDNQTSVLVQVYRGERALTKDNELIGEFELKGLAPATRGVPRIEVIFELDIDGCLCVIARDTETGYSEDMTIVRWNSMSDDRAWRLEEEATQLWEADAAAVALVREQLHRDSNAETAKPKQIGRALALVESTSEEDASIDAEDPDEQEWRDDRDDFDSL